MPRAMGPKPKADGTVEKTRTFHCPYCDNDKKETEFYVSTDPLVLTGRVTMCKECCEKIARRYSSSTRSFGDCTQQSCCDTLERIDKPFIQTIWDAAIKEVTDCTSERPKSNVWAAYIKNITSLKQYRTMRWKDGDLFNNNNSQTVESAVTIQNQDVINECEKNKKDIIRLVGYDPYEKEDSADQPLLYSQLIGYLDMSGNNDDMMRISSAITIVRGYLQLQKLDDMIAKAMASATKTSNSGEIKAYLDSKQKISATISQLAEQSCISLKHNKNSFKGENTWTGKVRIMKEMNLRDAEVNIFDVETAAGIAQVADVSNASILKQVMFDENDYVSMLSEQKRLIDSLNKQTNEAIEKARLLLRENIDLKKLLEQNEIDISEDCSKESILYKEDEVMLNE